MIIKHKRCLKTFESYLLELVIAVRINLNKKTSMQTMSFLYDVKKKHLRFTDLSLSTCPHWVVGGLLWPWAEVFLSQHQCSAPPALLAPKSQCRPMLTALPPSAWTRPPLTPWTQNSFRSWPKLSLTQKRLLRWIFICKSTQIPEPQPQHKPTVLEITNFALDLFSIFVPQAIVLTSGNKVFCAGLDITEMYQPNQERLETFWGSLQDLWLATYGCKLPMTAAITGHR